MMHRKWFWTGLIVVNALALMVVVADWRRQEVRRMESSLINQGPASIPTIELLEFDPQEQKAPSDSIVAQGSEPVDGEYLSVEEAKVEIAEGPDEPPSSLDPVMSCLIFGPFSVAQQARMELSATPTMTAQWVGISPLGRSVANDSSIPEGYRVYVSPRKSLEAAYELLKVFRSQGFDSYVMTEGVYARGISLGVFSSEFAAQKLLGQLSPRLRSYAKVGEASPEQRDAMLRVLFSSEVELSALRRIFPSDIDSIGRICDGPHKTGL